MLETEFGEALGQLLATFDASTAVDRVATLKSGIASLFLAAGVLLPATLADALQAQVDITEEWAGQFRDWATGTAVGGPSSDGFYPIVDRSGLDVLLPSPAKLVDILFQINPQGTVPNEAALAALTATAEKGDLYVALDTGYAHIRAAEGAAAPWINIGSMLALSGQAPLQVPCDTAGSTANHIVLDPLGDVVDNGRNQTFSCHAALGNTGALIGRINGIHGVSDPRQIRFPDDTQVPAGHIHAGQYCEFHYYLDTGLIELIHPPKATASGGGSLNVWVPINQTNTHDRNLVFAIEGGAAVPSPATLVRFYGQFEQTHTEGGLTVEITGFNGGDPRQLVTPDTSLQIPLGLAKPGVPFVIGWDGSGFDLIEPRVLGTATTGFVRAKLAAGSTSNSLIVDPIDPLPNNTGYGTMFWLEMEQEHVEG